MAQRLIYLILGIFLLISVIALGFAIFQVFEEVEIIESNAQTSQLVDPEMSSDPKVMQGFRLMTETQKYAPNYAGDKISCNNCHFNGGNSFGGKNNGISLVGVSKVYPRYSKREQRDISLAERINNCFERSLNGRPLPVDSDEMQAFLAYLEWISTPVAHLEEFPWLGLPKLEVQHQPSPERGKELYHQHCASCHGANGEGTITEEGNNIPPLWGNQSFNDGAGMNRIEMFAPFIYLNMPYGDPFLTKQQALDIASFVTTQPRPKYHKRPKFRRMDSGSHSQ